MHKAAEFGAVLAEAALVAVVGMAMAFAANEVSPRGVILTRNYFPGYANNSAPSPDTPVSRTESAKDKMTNSTVRQLVGGEFKREGLRWVDRPEAVQLFHESRLKPGVVFVDARDESSYLAGHIPAAREFDPYHPEKYSSVIPVCQAAKRVVVYCNGANCDDSQTAALLLKDLGIPEQKLLIYGGGITDWISNNLPIETGPLNTGNLHGGAK